MLGTMLSLWASNSIAPETNRMNSLQSKITMTGKLSIGQCQGQATVALKDWPINRPTFTWFDSIK